MTVQESFDRRLGMWLDEEAGDAPPAYLDEILGRTAATGQRSSWSSLERWLPVDTTLRPVPAARPSMYLVWLLLLAATFAAIYAAGNRPRLPAPFGPAANGTIAYAVGGDIYRFDPDTGGSTVLIGGASYDLAPTFSPDGTKLAFGRQIADGQGFVVMVANPDGTNVRSLTEPLAITSWSWSPDGSRFAVNDTKETAIRVVGLDGSPIRRIEVGMLAESLQWLRDGEEILFRGVPAAGSTGYGLYVVRANGDGLRAIVPPTDSPDDWQAPALSPDGRRVVYTQWSGSGRLFIVDVASGATTMPGFLGATGSDYFATWSPDGTRLVFNRGRAQESYRIAIAPAAGGAVVDIGPDQPWAAAASAAFSPDGSQVVVRYSDDRAWLFDVDGGPSEVLGVTDTFPPSWQRLAP